MFRHKEFTGIYAEYSAENTQFQSYGTTYNITCNKSLTHLFGMKLAEFLQDCGCTDARFDAVHGYVWIFGIPYFFAVNSLVTNYFYITLYLPFTTSIALNGNFSGGTTGTNYAYATFYFNIETKEYKIPFRLAGDSNTGFYLRFFRHVYRTRSTANSIWQYVYLSTPSAGNFIALCKGKDIFREQEARFFALNASTIHVWNINSANNPVDIGYSDKTLSVNSSEYSLETSTKEAEDIPNKILLRKCIYKIFELENVYMYPKNLGLPVLPSNKSEDEEVFIEMNGEKFWIASNGNNYMPIVRCTTPD